MRERVVQSQIRVRYAETDAQGFAHHANYMVYFEVGRSDFLRTVQIDYNAIEAAGAFVVVVEGHTCYHAPARFDEELTLETRLTELRTRSLRFEYRVTRKEADGTERLVASGWTSHLVVNSQGKPIRLPEKLRELIEGAPQASKKHDNAGSEE